MLLTYLLTCLLIGNRIKQNFNQDSSSQTDNKNIIDEVKLINTFYALVKSFAYTNSTDATKTDEHLQ